MSILLVELVPQGIIFGADRNISTERIEIKHVDDGEDGKRFIEQHHHHYSYSPRPKVLRWPQRQALIGYAGAAAINDSPTDEWLYEFIGNHLNFTNFETLAEA